MNNKPIGIFDSGLGGLTAVKELIRILPGESIVYFGDTGRVPYGSRSQETILKYAKQDIAFLQSFDIKIIIAACGTVSSVALPHLENQSGVEVIGVVEPTARAAVRSTKTGVIAVLGTPSTIASGAYEREIKKHKPDAEVYSVACPLFVPLVENGYTNGIVIETIAKEYLNQIPKLPDTIILGCTHYPLLKSTIRDIMGKEIALIDAGKAAADHVKEILTRNNMLSSGEHADYQYYVSDSASGFSALAEVFLEQKIDHIEKIDIEKIQGSL